MRRITTSKNGNSNSGNESENSNKNSTEVVEMKGKKDGMNILDGAEVRENLGLTKEEFIDFGLLCGTDFTDRIPK